MNYKKILRIALPAMGENVLQMLMGLVDNYLVAQLGLLAVSGVSVANNIITIYQAIFIALGAAVSSLIARSLGQGDKKQIDQFQLEVVFLTLLLSLFLGLFSILLGQELLTFLGTEPAVSQVGGLYLSFVGGGIVSLGLFTGFSAICRALGKVKLPMYLSLLTNVLNALFSALSIFVFDWGIVGVALATVISRLIGVLILARQLDWSSILMTGRWKISADFLHLALPAAGERLMMRAGDVVVVAIIVLFGTPVLAGNAIGESLTQFNYMPGLAVATATVILVAHAYGEGDMVQVRAIVRESYWLSTVLMLAIGGMVFLGRVWLPQFFTQDAQALAASQIVLLASFLGGPITAGTLMMTATWQGLGRAKLPFYATTIGMWGIRLLASYLLGVQLGLGLAGVWLATILDNLFRCLFLSHHYRQLLKSKI